jgi:Cu(I)/Ag(I) efflux system membrane fusion protein
MRKLVILALVIIAFVLGYFLRGGGPETKSPLHQQAGEEEVKLELWTCSMHPQIQLPKSGQCPICWMDLIPVSSGDMGDDEGPRELKMSAKAIKLAEIEVALVERRVVTNEVRMVGKVDYDETRLGYITAWVPGRIDRLFVDYTGVSVKKGDQMVYLYSPELLTAQEELIQAIKTVGELKHSEIVSINKTAQQLVDAVREKLRLWGLTKKQIEEIERRGKTSEHITIYAPMSGVVIHKNGLEGMYVETGTKIYESDLAWIKHGQEVRFETEAYPGKTFRGKIAFIDPVINAKTRTVKVRINVPNPDGRLKPEMFVRAVVKVAPLGFGTSDAAESEASLVIPASAPLITGRRAVVYVAVPGKEGTYEGREIVLGPRAGDYYLVRDGLNEGELVVVNGNFKIDSALQILAKPSMMSPEKSGPTPGDQEELPQKAKEEKLEPFEVPEVFKTQIDGILSVYFKIQQALSQDNFKEARDGAKKLPEALDTVDMGLLTGAAHVAWMKEQMTLKKRAREVSSAENIEGARSRFIPLSESIYIVAKRFGTSGTQPILRFHCPMASGGEGAYWLQNKPGTENPYYGSAMFKCGDQVETIFPGHMEEQSGEHKHE